MPVYLLRMITSLAAAILTLELCARLEDTITYGASFWGVYSQDILYDRPGPDFEGVPGARYLKWRMNSLGYRGPEPSQGSLRVVCVGASETFGLNEPEDREWPRRLEELLSASPDLPRPVTVINAAYPGSNLRTHIHQAPQLLRKARPDLVVIYTNPAAYISSESYEVLKAAPLPRVQIRVLAKAQDLRRKAVPVTVMTPLRRISIERSLRGRGAQATNRIRPENIDLFQEDLNRLLDIYQAQRVPVVLVTHANRFGLRAKPEDMPMLTSWRLFYPTLLEDGFIDMEKQLNDRIRRMADARRMVLVDAAARMPSGEFYFADFAHFTEAGAAEMSKLVAAGVKEALQRAGTTR